MPIRRFSSLLAAAALALLPGLAAAQGTGQVAGRVIDQATGRPLASARVAVQGTTPQVAALSGVDGRFTLTRVPAGERTLVTTLLGYGVKTVTGVRVAAGATTAQDVTLSAQGIALEGITATAAVERGSVSRALDEQRTAAGVVNSVTADQIARSPDSDAAQAVQRVSGVTVQDGKFVFVRGLGERYTTTSLNGTRIPSPEPERRMVPLDLFPANLLQAITTSKTFTPDQPGDFSGAQVNIRTREYPTRPTFSFSLSTGLNPEVTGKGLPFAPTVGDEWLAYGADNRSLPARVRQAELTGQLYQGEKNRVIRSFRNVWSTEEQSGAPNVSAAFTLGGSRDIFGREFGYLASGTYSNASEVRAGQVRGTALAGEDGVSAVEASRFEGTTAARSVLWGGIVNLSYRLGEGSRIDFNNAYNRGADNEGRREFGSTENLGRVPLILDRLRYVERAVRSNQLRGDHLVAGRHRLGWSLSSSGVDRVEPDRSEIVYSAETDAGGAALAPAWFGGSNEAAVRTFGDLDEDALEAAGDLQLELGRGARPHRVKFGGLYRTTERDAENFAYSISAPGTLARGELERRPEEIFDGRHVEPGDEVLNVTTLSAGGSYGAEDRLAAGYGMVELFLRENVRLIGGARVERSEVEVSAQPTFGDAVRANPTYTDVLPSVALNWGLTDAQNLRVSYSRTLSRPEYREIAPIAYRDVLGGELVRGNEKLQRALIDNFDVRWELYPTSGEVLSVGVFAKRFHDPIERVYLATSGTAIVTFENAESGENYGVELEARKELGFLSERLERLTFFTNATLMHSRIKIGSDVTSRTSDDRAMVGQAPYVFNAGLTYAGPERGLSATLLYNVVGRRIVAASEAPLPNVYEEPRHMFDFSLRMPLRRGWDLKLDAENLLDSPYEVRQGDVLREYYRTGRALSLGVSAKR